MRPILQKDEHGAFSFSLPSMSLIKLLQTENTLFCDSESFNLSIEKLKTLTKKESLLSLLKDFNVVELENVNVFEDSKLIYALNQEHFFSIANLIFEGCSVSEVEDFKIKFSFDCIHIKMEKEDIEKMY